MTAPRMFRQPRGFTLVEAIVVIAVIGIIAAIVAAFIRTPVQNYIDTATRAELTDEADLALRRMARDIRLALPNSVRVSADGRAIEFLLTKTGGRYLAQEDGVADRPVLDFTNPANTGFTVVGELPGGSQQIEAGDWIAVYNLGIEHANAYLANAATGARNIARVTDVDAARKLVQLASNPFAQQDPPLASPTRRFQVVTGPVTYFCGNGQLTRQSGYAISAAQVAPPVAAGPGENGSAVSRLLAARVGACRFDYGSTANQRTALVSMTLELLPRSANHAGVTLVHQIHVENTP
ncbi:prepilin-type N-terminal cleavage/methylation domain-containing protein [Massilia sp. MS-15]|uniref:prepilin-type N-terminal cleavage/methylation domain-containing protein n=1 Tax=Massilia sp. MS-15 TaxID=2878200 RepID=UPI001CD198B4|nr:prepilin-type N-terminal cleavage/methylation domain-containing protein [Massilia sp. MS-15]MCA1245828.1 prepilin-type N-terminal cleavage/methylation domain-containing protein [Massilia sp. MS-15]